MKLAAMVAVAVCAAPAGQPLANVSHVDGYRVALRDLVDARRSLDAASSLDTAASLDAMGLDEAIAELARITGVAIPPRSEGVLDVERARTAIAHAIDEIRDHAPGDATTGDKAKLLDGLGWIDLGRRAGPDYTSIRRVLGDAGSHASDAHALRALAEIVAAQHERSRIWKPFTSQCGFIIEDDGETQAQMAAGDLARVRALLAVPETDALKKRANLALREHVEAALRALGPQRLPR